MTVCHVLLSFLSCFISYHGTEEKGQCNLLSIVYTSIVIIEWRDFDNSMLSRLDSSDWLSVNELCTCTPSCVTSNNFHMKWRGCLSYKVNVHYVFQVWMCMSLLLSCLLLNILPVNVYSCSAFMMIYISVCITPTSHLCANKV